MGTNMYKPSAVIVCFQHHQRLAARGVPLAVSDGGVSHDGPGDLSLEDALGQDAWIWHLQ